MALTATATATVRKDIVDMLRLKENSQRTYKEYCQSVYRPNLHYSIVYANEDDPEELMDKDLVSYIKSIFDKHASDNDVGIVYCRRKDRCDQVAAMLRRSQVVARSYHADLSTKARHETVDEWMAGKCKVVVATVAFGMGIDKANVRFVVHYSLPKSLAAYYQVEGE